MLLGVDMHLDSLILKKSAPKVSGRVKEGLILYFLPCIKESLNSL